MLRMLHDAALASLAKLALATLVSEAPIAIGQAIDLYNQLIAKTN